MPLKKEFLKLLDLVIGTPLIYTLSLLPFKGKKSPPLNKEAKCLFIRPGGIGDAAALLPAISCLKASNPGWQIDVLAEKRNADIFRACDDINKIYLYDNWQGLLNSFLNGYDIAIDTEQWHRLSAITALLCAPYRVGFGTNIRKKMFSSVIRYQEEEREPECFMRLIEFSVGGGPPKSHFLTPPFFSLNDKEYEPLLGRVNSVRREKKVSIAMGGSIPEKVWSKDGFRSLIRTLINRGWGVILIGGEGERALTREILRGVALSEEKSSALLDLTGRVSLLETAAAIGKTSLLISGDTGVLHIGTAIGVSTLSLFGPGNSKKWAPEGEGHIHINASTPCSPCSRFGYTPKCPERGACMRSITSAQVEEAAILLLGRVKEAP